MFLAHVTGVIVATIKHPHLHGRKLLLVRPEPPSVIAVDSVDAGLGDRVLVADEGNTAAQVLAMPRGPVRTIIVGVVDEVMHEGTPASPEPPRGGRTGAKGG